MRSTLRSPSPGRAGGSPRKSVRIRPAADFSNLLDVDGDGEIGYDEWVAAFKFVDQDGHQRLHLEGGVYGYWWPRRSPRRHRHQAQGWTADLVD
ncbi:unnamed protein product [Prorocentrum cordatum]|uniref:EF-hand domain-containing protein n=1 Tax=Prorocentrum cordatum TaxID=2364126 RepID=A0ABN9XDC5_9DINO|nr:unnamed protein product [Polarella glacialis]